MEKNAIGYNDLCEAVGKATLNLVGDEGVHHFDVGIFRSD